MTRCSADQGSPSGQFKAVPLAPFGIIRQVTTPAHFHFRAGFVPITAAWELPSRDTAIV